MHMVIRNVRQVASPALIAAAGAGGAAMLATANFTPVRPDIAACWFAMACVAAALMDESLLIWASGTGHPSPSARAWAYAGTIAFTFMAGGIRLAYPLSHHQIAYCVTTYLALVVLLTAGLIGLLGFDLVPHVIPVGIACLLLFALAACAEWQAAPGAGATVSTALLFTVGGGFVSVLLLALVRSRMEYEAAVTPLDKPGSGDFTPAASGRVTAALGMVALVALSSFVSLLMLTYVSARAAKISPHVGLVTGDRALGWVAAITAASTIALWAVRRQVTAHWPMWITRSVCLTIILALALAMIVDCGSRPFSVLAVVISVVVGLWNLNSVIDNVALLQLRRTTRYTIGLAASAALLGAAITYWSLVAAVTTSGGPRSFAVSAALVTSAIMLHVLLISTIPAVELDPSLHITEFTVQHNLFQDALSISAIILIIEWPVQFLHASSGQWWLALSLSAGLVPLFSSGFIWAIRSNREHVQRQAQRLLHDDASRVLSIARTEGRLDRRLGVLARAGRNQLDGSPDERFIRILSAHTKNQNLLAYTAVTAAIVGAVAILLEGIKDSAWMDRLAALSRFGNTIPPGRP
jgi:hypothetical protein